jgi:hypothetical protein
MVFIEKAAHIATNIPQSIHKTKVLLNEFVHLIIHNSSVFWVISNGVYIQYH